MLTLTYPYICLELVSLPVGIFPRKKSDDGGWHLIVKNLKEIVLAVKVNNEFVEAEVGNGI